MWNTPENCTLQRVPTLYGTEGVPVKQKIVHLHFFIGDCDWFIVEYDGADTFFGFAILHGDFRNAEWGYVNFDELKAINIHGFEIECDRYWKARKASEVEKIAEACGWALYNKVRDLRAHP